MVLLVDDDPVFLEHAERTLTEAGIWVLPAPNGTLALTALRSVPEISLVVLDLDLPDIGGMSLIGDLREIRRDLKIIAMTGVLPEHVLEIAKYLGAETTLEKPMTSEWVTTIRGAEAQARARGGSE